MKKNLQMVVHDLAQLDEKQGAITITGLTADSRKVKRGNLFAALSGTSADGAKFADQAVEKGAVAILAGTDAELSDCGDAVVIRHAEPRLALAKMAAHFYGEQPGCVVAVTGTNGKSSVVSFVRQVWQGMGLSGASFGTLGITWQGGFEKLALTTPDPVQVQRKLASLKSKGVTHLALEASSHGLEQYRLDGVSICSGAFTNFSRDHLDYHETEEAYFASKMRLFTELLEPGASAVINMDDPKSDTVLQTAEDADLLCLRVGEQGRELRLINVEPLDMGQELTIAGHDGTHKVYLPLVGRFQAENALVAVGLVVASGGSEAIAIKALENLKGAKGRLELVYRADNGAAVFVDYAHTPDALATALKTLRPFARGKLKVVFGCGGDRDQGKRPEMGKVAADLADVVYVTDDNPRNEDPAAIRAQALEGCPGATEIGDRRAAIAAAMEKLAEGDVVLIAGKGHEEGQIVAGKTIPFSDHEVVLAVTGGAAA